MRDRFRRFVLVPFAAVLLAVPLGAQSPAWQATLSDFSEHVAEVVDAEGVGGVVAGVVVDGDLVWAQAFGLSDRDAKTPMATSSVLRTGSISKTVTALLMMRLIDDGVIGLDEPVERYLPSFASVADRRPDAPTVTFRHLASHTAGLVREPDWRESVVGPIELWDKRIVESLARTRYDSIPGARYQYSNIGFGALGLALERAADRPFMDMVRDEIFGPLGMTGSEFVVVGAELEPRLAVGYTRSREGVVSSEQPTREHAGRGYKVPNGGVYSTVADLGRFLGALAGVPGLQVISEDSRLEMVTVQTPEDPANGYGLGVTIRTDPEGRRYVGHGGSVAGYNASMLVELDSRIGVVLLRNYGGGDLNLGGAAQGLILDLVAQGRTP